MEDMQKKNELGNIIYKTLIGYTEGELEQQTITNGHHLAQNIVTLLVDSAYEQIKELFRQD